MSRIYGNIGFSGLWNGLPVRIVMIGTLTGEFVSKLLTLFADPMRLGFQWLIYDTFKVYCGLPTTGGH